MNSNLKNTCPCGSLQSLGQCCWPIINKTSRAETPEKLMRSRFSAYVLKKYDYIVNTYASEPRKQLNKTDISQASVNTSWCKLELVDTEYNEATGVVEFIAYYQEQGQFFAMHEKSEFVLENKQWRYLTGTMLAKTGKIILGRNDACLCGSGKKYKRCCGP